MTKDMKITAITQAKISQYTEKISVGRSRPERLSRHLRKPELSDALMHGHLEAQREKLGVCEYLLVDMTDISKEYGTNHRRTGRST